jgi:spore maturation protein CgeB/SAM-dependent methyltransferase
MTNKDKSKENFALTDDEIARVYLGEYGGSIQRNKARARIDWMVERMEGERALDIGCSQGILELLLCRRNIQVLGIDNNPNAISFARQLLDNEPVEVKHCAVFQQCDFMVEDIAEANFDTVYLGEIIEHLSQPSPLIHKAVDKLKDGGRLVITTPHGFLPHEDHYHAFGLDEVLALLPDSISVVDLDVADGYIRMVGKKIVGGQINRPSDSEIVKLSNRSLIQQQKFFYDLLNKKNAQLASFERKIDGCSRREETLNHKLQDCTKCKTELEQKLNDYITHMDSFERKLNDYEKRQTALEKQNRNLRRKLSERDFLIAKYKSGRAFQFANILLRAYKKPWPEAVYLLPRTIKLAFLKPEGNTPEKEIRLKGKIKKNKKTVYQVFHPIKTNYVTTTTVAAILDEFSESCFRYEWNLVLLKRKDWRDQILKRNPSFLFVESAWRGNSGQWSYLLTKYKEKDDNPLRELISFCKDIGLPCVFWNKEDPANYELFKHVAMDFDYIFTTDANCINNYREFCGHDRVYALPFAAQPVIHNPAQRFENKIREVAFGGAWYAEKHTDRQKYLPILLNAAIKLNMKLSIFNRFSDLKDNPKYRFPDLYHPYIRSGLPYGKMLSAYRMFPIFLNVNSVIDSPTMFSRRVFELLACGTAVVSSRSTGMTDMLNDIVHVANNETEAIEHLQRLRDAPEKRRRLAHIGYRKVLNEHTYSARAQKVIDIVLESNQNKEKYPMISVVLTTNRPHYLQRCKENYTQQNYPNKELILVLNIDDISQSDVEKHFEGTDKVKIFKIPEEKNLPECLNHVLKYIEGDYWAKFDDDDIYGSNYLADSILPFSFTDADIVGKGTYFARIEGDDPLYLRHQSKEHSYVKIVCGGTLVVSRHVTDKILFNENLSRGSDTAFLRAAHENGFRIYSGDRFNFIQMRDFNNKKHTWNISKKDYLKKCIEIESKHHDKFVFI